MELCYALRSELTKGGAPIGDQPTLRLILCTDKNDTVVKYTLGPDQQNKIFASRYKLHLPSEKELQDEIRREVRFLTAGESKRPRRKTKR